MALVLQLALACGGPLVSTHFPGIEEVLGDLPPTYCRLVDLPRLKKLNTTYPEDEALFEMRLAAAIRDQRAAVLEEPKMDPALLTPILEAYSWTRVFERVGQVLPAGVKPDRSLNAARDAVRFIVLGLTRPRTREEKMV